MLVSRRENLFNKQQTSRLFGFRFLRSLIT